MSRGYIRFWYKTGTWDVRVAEVAYYEDVAVMPEGGLEPPRD